MLPAEPLHFCNLPDGLRQIAARAGPGRSAGIDTPLCAFRYPSGIIGLCPNLEAGTHFKFKKLAIFL